MGKKEQGFVSLFPYQIKRRDNFIFHKQHPKNLNPESTGYKKYWKDQLKFILEGKWINDEGTWVYMMPKLYFYVNYAKIANYERKVIHPVLRDNEWIVFTYLLCCEGFSGFELDEEYTCHYLIEKHEKDPEALDSIQFSQIPKSAKKEDGTFKKYLNPWYYLTRHYLLDKPPEKPLGQPLYENPRYNGAILSARGVGKSLSVFVGDFGHEFLTSGIKRLDESDQINNRLWFGMGCADSRQLDRSMANVKAFYYDMPGQYSFPDGTSYMGPFYKRVQGGWTTGSSLTHIVKNKDGTTEIDGSEVQMMALTKDKITVGAGDRFRRIYWEEFGFLSTAVEVHAANKDSLISEGVRIGSAFYLGTGGNIEAIRQPKMMFENPESFDIFGIPNYWKNENKKIGLFIPWYYALRDYKDKQGNTRLAEAYEYCSREREEYKTKMDSVSFESHVMFNPLRPEEMLRPNSSSVLPKQEAQNQLDNIEAYDLFRKRAQIGKIIFDPLQANGVSWRKDLTGDARPILSWGYDDKKVDKQGAVIIYEQPPENIPDGLYWVIYDPVKNSGDGTSFHSILVYKHFYVGNEKTMEDAIVAEWIGRKERLDENYQMVINLSRYFNAKIFPEINVAGFVEWCKKNDHGHRLESDAYLLEKEISPNHKRSWYKVGFEMQKRKKAWCLRKLRDWLTQKRDVDPITGITLTTNMNYIFSPRILSEIIAYSDDPDENFDHISSLLGLMLLQGKLEGKAPADLSGKKELEIEMDLIPQIERVTHLDMRARCEFLRY